MRTVVYGLQEFPSPKYSFNAMVLIKAFFLTKQTFHTAPKYAPNTIDN